MLGYDNDNNSASTARHIEWLVIGNYLIDFDYLLDEIPELLSIPNVVVFYGHADTSEQPWKSACADAIANGAVNVNFVRLDPSDPPGLCNPTGKRVPDGVHHSKFFLVGYSDATIRVIIHTANLRYTDIHVKAQAAYIQDFSLKQQEKQQQNNNNDSTNTDASSNSPPTTCDFEETLVAYLDTYNYHKPHAWSQIRGSDEQRLTDWIRRYDFSTASVALLPSTPGYHPLDGAQPVGHRKLRQAMNRYTGSFKAEKIRPIICQFSSIGSLTDKYLHELQASMDNGMAKGETKYSVSNAPMRLQLVYPTIAEIQLSIEGYHGGGSVPGTTKNVSKPFLQSLYRKWSSSAAATATTPTTPNTNPLWKSRNVPHINTYYQLDDGGNSMLWFTVTSHNMSKAAWGEVKDSREGIGIRRLFVRHWELGVFMSPRTLRAERLVPWSEQGPFLPGDVTVPQPYSLHPQPYDASDRPWAVDVRYSEPDTFGRYSLQDP
jgi:tyrosyl-DNA phosphodiesterase-1